MSTLSICTICQDEDELIGLWLDSCVHVYKYLKDDLKEVIIVDGGSLDKTVEIINSYKDKLPLILIEYPFDTFGQQKNRGMEEATGDFIFYPDADITWTTNFPGTFKSGHYNSNNFWEFRVMTPVGDKYHIIKQNMGVTMRLWKRGPIYVTNFHEKLEGMIHKGKMCEYVFLFDNCLMQSDAKLMHRGERYQKFTEELVKEGMGPGPADRFYNARHTVEIVEMEDQYRKMVL